MEGRYQASETFSKAAHVKSLEESHDEIVSILQQQALDKWLAELTAKADVKILNPEYRLTANPDLKGDE